MFLRRSEFYMTIRFSHAFLLIFWGGSPPETFWGFSGYFSTFSYLWNYFLLFLGGSGGEAPEIFWDFSIFWRGGGLPRIFFLTFFWLFDVWKKSRGGVQKKSFFLTSFFYGPYAFSMVRRNFAFFLVCTSELAPRGGANLQKSRFDQTLIVSKKHNSKPKTKNSYICPYPYSELELLILSFAYH